MSVVQGGIYKVICFPAPGRILVRNDLGSDISYASWRFEILGTFTDLEAEQIKQLKEPQNFVPFRP